MYLRHWKTDKGMKDRDFFWSPTEKFCVWGGGGGYEQEFEKMAHTVIFSKLLPILAESIYQLPSQLPEIRR